MGLFKNIKDRREMETDYQKLVRKLKTMGDAGARAMTAIEKAGFWGLRASDELLVRTAWWERYTYEVPRLIEKEGLSYARAHDRAVALAEDSAMNSQASTQIAGTAPLVDHPLGATIAQFQMFTINRANQWLFDTQKVHHDQGAWSALTGMTSAIIMFQLMNTLSRIIFGRELEDPLDFIPRVGWSNMQSVGRRPGGIPTFGLAAAPALAAIPDMLYATYLAYDGSKQISKNEEPNDQVAYERAIARRNQTYWMMLGAALEFIGLRGGSVVSSVEGATRQRAKRGLKVGGQSMPERIQRAMTGPPGRDVSTREEILAALKDKALDYITGRAGSEDEVAEGYAGLGDAARLSKGLSAFKRNRDKSQTSIGQKTIAFWAQKVPNQSQLETSRRQARYLFTLVGLSPKRKTGFEGRKEPRFGGYARNIAQWWDSPSGLSLQEKRAFLQALTTEGGGTEKDEEMLFDLRALIVYGRSLQKRGKQGREGRQVERARKRTGYWKGALQPVSP